MRSVICGFIVYTSLCESCTSYILSSMAFNGGVLGNVQMCMHLNVCVSYTIDVIFNAFSVR